MKAFIKRTMQSTALLMVISTSAFVGAEVISSTVDMNDIHHIKIGGDFKVVVTQGDPEFVRVITDEENLSKLEVKVKGDVLRIDKKHVAGLWGIKNGPQAEFEVQVKDIKSIENRDSGELKVMPITSNGRLVVENRGSGNLTMTSLQVRKTELNSRGSGDIQIESIDADDVEVNVRGSGDFSLDKLITDELELNVYGSADLNIGKDDGSRAEELDISIRGSGDVKAQNVIAEYADVSIYGSGDARVNVTKRLEVEIRGSGDVLYRGDPSELEEQISGSGDVRSIK